MFDFALALVPAVLGVGGAVVILVRAWREGLEWTAVGIAAAVAGAGSTLTLRFLQAFGSPAREELGFVFQGFVLLGVVFCVLAVRKYSKRGPPLRP